MQTNLTVKGQVTIPKSMRDHLGLAAGSPVRFAYTEGGGVAILPARMHRAPVKPAQSRFAKLKGVNRNGWAAAGLKSTGEIMGWLRGYGEDARDPGFAADGAVGRPAAQRTAPPTTKRVKSAATNPSKPAAKQAAPRKK